VRVRLGDETVDAGVLLRQSLRFDTLPLATARSHAFRSRSASRSLYNAAAAASPIAMSSGLARPPRRVRFVQE